MPEQRFFEIGSRQFVVNFRPVGRLKNRKVKTAFQARCPEVNHSAESSTIDGAFNAYLDTLPSEWIDSIIDSLPYEEQKEVRLWLQDDPHPASN